ncbi:MAG: hypothetical protein WCN88_02850 [Candidatus Falkowbacteria bacterium]
MTIKNSANFLKKSSIILGLFFIFNLFLSFPVLADYSFSESSGLKTTGSTAGYNESSATPEQLVGRVILIVLGFVGVIFLAFMIWAGIEWMTAQGNDQKVTRAKNKITEAIVGLIIVVAAYAIAYYVIKYFSATNLV